MDQSLEIQGPEKEHSPLKGMSRYQREVSFHTPAKNGIGGETGRRLSMQPNQRKVRAAGVETQTAAAASGPDQQAATASLRRCQGW